MRMGVDMGRPTHWHSPFCLDGSRPESTSYQLAIQINYHHRGVLRLTRLDPVGQMPYFRPLDAPPRGEQVGVGRPMIGNMRR